MMRHGKFGGQNGPRRGPTLYEARGSLSEKSRINLYVEKVGND